MIKVCNKCMEPFYKNWKGFEKLSTENFCREILSGQNDDIIWSRAPLVGNTRNLWTRSPMNKLVKLIKISKSVIVVYIFNLLKFFVNFSKPFVYRFWFVSVIKIVMCFKFSVMIHTYKKHQTIKTCCNIWWRVVFSLIIWLFVYFKGIT